MHDAAYAWVKEITTVYGPWRRVLELGAHDWNGSPRPLFKGAECYVGVDLQQGKGVDVVADARTYIPDFTPDCVVTTELLEHTPSADQIIANAARYLAPGGALIVTTATHPRQPHSALGGGALKSGEGYQNIEPDSMVRWLRPLPFQTWVMEVHRDRGDLYVLAIR